MLISAELPCRNHSLRTLVILINRSQISIGRDSVPQSLCYCMFVPHIYGCCSLCTSCSWWIADSTQCQRRGCNNISSFSQRTALIARYFCEKCTLHDLHILVTAPFCYDQKARAASAQSFTLWQQATMEITRRDHSPSILVNMSHCSQVNIGRASTPQSLFAYASHYFQLFTSWYWQRFQAAITLLLLLRATYIWMLLFAHIPFVVNHTFNATPSERLEQQQANVEVAWQHQSIIVCLCHIYIYGCCSLRTSCWWWIAHSTQRQMRGWKTCSKIGLDFWK